MSKVIPWPGRSADDWESPTPELTPEQAEAERKFSAVIRLVTSRPPGSGVRVSLAEAKDQAETHDRLFQQLLDEGWLSTEDVFAGLENAALWHHYLAELDPGDERHARRGRGYDRILARMLPRLEAKAAQQRGA